MYNGTYSFELNSIEKEWPVFNPSVAECIIIYAKEWAKRECMQRSFSGAERTRQMQISSA